jgi:hypothetical protein
MTMTPQQIRDTLSETTIRLTFLAQVLSGTDETNFHLTDDGIFGLAQILRDMAEDVKAAEGAL